jgi:hypothetical protein
MTVLNEFGRALVGYFRQVCDRAEAAFTGTMQEDNGRVKLCR